jgi:SAM-dependent methyltransferase
VTDGVGAHHEKRYQAEPEPWAYSDRAIEMLRHDWVAATVADLAPKRVLDLGCSVGQLTARLAALPVELHAMDVAPSAVPRARMRVRERPAAARVAFACGSATELPFATGSFDVVVASDGIYSWDLSPAARARALRELRRVVADDGRVVFTEHMRREKFASFFGEIEAEFSVIRSGLLYDRLWYQFESWFAAIRRFPGVGMVLRAKGVGRALSWVGRGLGEKGARHAWVVAGKGEPQ